MMGTNSLHSVRKTQDRMGSGLKRSTKDVPEIHTAPNLYTSLLICSTFLLLSFTLIYKDFARTANECPRVCAVVFGPKNFAASKI